MSTPATQFEPVTPMSREEYLAWAEQQPHGRFERIHGIVVARDGAAAMAPERINHNRRKFRVALALDQAVRAANLPCDVYTDGITVRVEDSDYEPDAVVHCGGELPGDAVAVPDPLIIVEVLSPSSGTIDRALKLREYFKLPSVMHYLVVWPDRRQVVHHRRGDNDMILTKAIVAGMIKLDPPGITITVENIYAN